ncbi:PadR family transcriptional regulator [Burkholderiaceae bacterium DAT-1]|nr:PadR family transcriptional regulator [Burkholderiaceae bacterium DAT-1]
MKTNLERTALEISILTLLSERDCYWYEIYGELVKQHALEERLIYPLLRHMQADLLVSSYLVNSPSGSRRYFKLCDSGRTLLGEQSAIWQSVGIRLGGLSGGAA